MDGASIEMTANRIQLWLRGDRVYHGIMNAALVIGFLSALSTQRWPEMTFFAEVVIVAVTISAMTVYFVARDDRSTSIKATGTSEEDPRGSMSDLVTSDLMRRYIREADPPGIAPVYNLWHAPIGSGYAATDDVIKRYETLSSPLTKSGFIDSV